GRPVWVDERGFTVERHLREVRCPDPGDDAALHEVAMQVLGTPLSLERPPWVAAVVHGAAGDRGALVIVFHHVLADGRAGLAALAQLLDGAPPPAPDGFPRPAPPLRRLLVDTVTRRARAVAHLPRG